VNQLITKSLVQEDVALLFGFPKQLMSTFETKVVEWISNYISKYHKPPTLPRLEKEFDGFIPIDSEDPLGDIYDQELQRKRNIFTREYILSIQDELKKGADPLPFIEKLHRSIRGGDSDVTLYSKYDRSEYLWKPTSINYGIDQIDKQTGGISPGDLVYIIGRLGTGKTSLALWILTQWLLKDCKILLVSNENRAADVVAKIDSYIGGWNPIKKRTMDWTEDDKHRIETVSFIASKIKGEVYIPNRPVQSTKDLRSLIYTYDPDLIMVDGIYLMSDGKADSQWEKITGVSRELKQIAEGEGKPLLGIHQASRKAIGAGRIDVEHVAYSDALAQDADLLLAINKEEDESIFVECIKNRWGGEHWGFFLKFFFETMTVKVMSAKTATEEDE
jgi:hypothetical protein